MQKLNVTPRQNVDADTARWYRDIASCVNELIDHDDFKYHHIFESMTPEQRLDVLSGAPTLDHTSLIQAALNSRYGVYFGDASCSYRVSAAITLRSGNNIAGNGASITQITTDTEIFNIEGKSNIEVVGLNFIGKGDDYSDSDSSRAVAFYGGTSGSNIHIHHNKFTGFTYTPVRFKAQTSCSFHDNVVIGPGSPELTAGTGRCYGVLFDSGCEGVLIHNNDISQTAQGVRLEGNTDVVVSGNRIFDIVGQHGMYIGSGMTNVAVIGNTINDVYNIGIKVQAADGAAINNTQVVVADNSITTCGDQGISFQNAVSGGTYKVSNSIIANNTIKGTAGNGINIADVLDVLVEGNTIDTATQSGILIANYSTTVIVHANNIKSTGLSGIANQTTSVNDVVITHNKIKSCATSNTASDEYGIFIQSGAEYKITDNIISDANANMKYGIYLAGTGNEGTFTLERNTVKQSTDYGLRVGATTALRLYRDNYWNGTLGTVFSEPVIPTVASAATITLPQGYRAVFISGTTNITTVNAGGHSNNTVTLIFQNALTFTDGSNLLLAGNFVTTANDTITITSDGANWYEVARSVN